MPTSTVTSKGQITIPKEVRERLGLRTGDRVSFDLREDGVVEMEPENLDLMLLCGIVKPKVKGVTVEEMDDTIAEAVVDRYEATAEGGRRNAARRTRKRG